MTTHTDAGGQPVASWEDAARTWLDVADMHRDSFGDDDPQNHELNALRDFADAIRPHLSGKTNRILPSITFAEDTEDETVRGVLRDLHGWTVKITTQFGTEHHGAISGTEENGAGTACVRLVPEHDLTLDDLLVTVGNIANVEIQ